MNLILDFFLNLSEYKILLVKFFYVLLLVSTNSICYGQGTFDFGISHAFPIAHLSNVYRSTIGGEVIKWDEDNEKIRRGTGFGFHIFKPKEKVFYYLKPPNNFGTIGYSRFWSFPLYYTFERKLKSKNQNFKPFIGINLGLNLIYIGFSEGGSVLNPDFSEGWGDNTLETLLAIDPKVGFTIPIKKARLTCYFRFNFSVSAVGESEGVANDNNGSIYPTWNYGFRYNFGK